MSAFQVSSRHISGLVGSYVNLVGADTAFRALNDLGVDGYRAACELVATENADAVNFRYRDTEAPVAFDEASLEEFLAQPEKPGRLLGAISCTIYQLAERNGWDELPATRLLRRMQADVASLYPLAERNGWEIY
jgi:hypothetical protein